MSIQDRQGNYQKYNSDGTTPTTIVGSLTEDGLSLAGSGDNALFNETSWDRQRGNTAGTLLASSTRTTTTYTPTQTNYNAKGVLVALNVTTASGTGGLQVALYGKEFLTGNNIPLNTLPTAITATGIYHFLLYPGTSGGRLTQVTSLPIPRQWLVGVDHADASNYTYSLSYSLIL